MARASAKYSRSTEEIIIDPTTIPEGVCKEIRMWDWKKLRTDKIIACNVDGKITLKPIKKK
jgi:hypothetical protein